MKTISGALLLPAMFLAAAFTLSAAGQVKPREKAAIDKFYSDWSQALFKEGADGYARFFAADATLLPDGEIPAIGRDAIREWFKRTQATATHSTIPEGITQDEIKIIKGIAIVRTTLKGKRVPKAGGLPTPFENKYFDILRRDRNGRWEFAYRMWNSNIK